MFRPGDTVIDLGFGQGHFLVCAAAHGVHAVGVDRDPRLVQRAVARGLRATAGDVRDVAAELGPVDGVLASHLIEHLTPSEVAKLLVDLSAIVRRGGLLVLATPNPADWRVISGWFWNDPTHVRPYPKGAVEQLMEPEHWEWDGDGYEPIVVTREAPWVLLNRIRFGRDYGRPGLWYRLRRPG